MTFWRATTIVFYVRIGLGCAAQTRIARPGLSAESYLFAWVAWPAFIGMGMARAVYAMPNGAPEK